MKCTKKDCGNEAEFVIDGQSVCKDHKEKQESSTMGDIMTGNIGL